MLAPLVSCRDHNAAGPVSQANSGVRSVLVLPTLTPDRKVSTRHSPRSSSSEGMVDSRGEPWWRNPTLKCRKGEHGSERTVLPEEVARFRCRD